MLCAITDYVSDLRKFFRFLFSLLLQCSCWWEETTRGTFLIFLSKATNLSKVYTNYCIRDTGASIPQMCMYGSSQVMSVTGHNSMQSLSVYQRVSDAEKIQMRESCSSIQFESNNQHRNSCLWVTRAISVWSWTAFFRFWPRKRPLKPMLFAKCTFNWRISVLVIFFIVKIILFIYNRQK